MKTGMRKVLRTAVRSSRLNNLFWYFYRLLQEPELDNRADEAFGVFTDSYGNRIELVAGLRDRVRPRWQAMLGAPEASEPLSPKDSSARLSAMRKRLHGVDGLLSTFSCSFAEKDVLEIGAYDGAMAYARAEAGAKSVVATELAEYYMPQSPNCAVCDVMVASYASLPRLRDAYRGSVDERIALRVSFRDDDICSSSLPLESADAVGSWEVLEHLTSPEDALSQCWDSQTGRFRLP